MYARISLVRQKNTREATIRQEGTRMAENGEDWTGLLMTTKYQFGKIEKHRRSNDKPRWYKDG